MFMMNFFLSCQHRLHKPVSALAQCNASAAKLPDKESLRRRVLATIGWLAGLTAILAGCSSNSASSDSQSASPASSFSPKDINNYATAVLAIEIKRRAAYKEIQNKINDEKFSEITCNKPDTIKDIDQSIQDIVVNYCKQAKQLVKDKSLTISKFNEITATAESSPELQTRIQDELLRLQK